MTPKSFDYALCNVRRWHQRTTNKRERQTLIRLQRSYVRLAVELEKAQADFATLKANELGDERDATRLRASDEDE